MRHPWQATAGSVYLKVSQEFYSLRDPRVSNFVLAQDDAEIDIRRALHH